MTDTGITRKKLLKSMQDKYVHHTYNDQCYGKHAKDVEFLEDIVADDGWEDSDSEEDKQARQITASALLGLR